MNCYVNVCMNVYVYMKVDVQKPGIYIPFAVTCNASRTLQMHRNQPLVVHPATLYKAKEGSRKHEASHA
jgi:hypothetical protein